MASNPSYLASTPKVQLVHMHEIAKKRIVIVPAEYVQRLGWTDTDSMAFEVEITEGGCLLYKPVRE